MPRVKIIWSNHISINYGEDDITIYAGPVTGWEEVSQDQLTFLEKNLHWLRHPSDDYRYRPHLLLDTGESVHDYMGEIAAAIDKHNTEQVKAKKVQEQAQKKRASTTRERRKAQFEKLRKEFEA